MNPSQVTRPTVDPRPVSSIASPAESRWREFAFFLVLILVCALTLSKNHPDPDSWGHVRYGMDMLDEGLPRTITYSYTTLDHPWINHEVLSELVMAQGIRWAGPAGLLGLKCLLGVALIGTLMILALRRGVSSLAVAAVALLAALNLMHFWVLRPQLASYLGFAALLLLLDRSFRSWDARALWRQRTDEVATRAALRRLQRETRWLWLAPLVLAVWANSHGGFVAGFGVFAVYLSGRCVEVLVIAPRRALLLVVQWLGLVVVAGLATLINPYGVELHAWLWQSLSESRPEIIEWRPAELLHVAWIPWWCLVVVAAVALYHGRKRIGFVELVILLVILWQAIEHRRNIPFFVIAFGLWLPAQVDGLFARLRAEHQSLQQSGQTSDFSGRWFAAGLIIAALVIVVTLRTQLSVIPVMRGAYPVSAFEYMAKNNVEGKLVSRFMWAQYALAAFGTSDPQALGTRLAFDGRFRTCYPQEVVDMYFDFALGNHATEPRNRSPHSPPIDGARILEFQQPDLVLLDRHQPHPVKLLAERRGDWVLLYQDKLAQLWGRATKYGDPASPWFLAPERRHITEEKQTGYAPWPAFPPPGGRQPDTLKSASTSHTIETHFLRLDSLPFPLFLRKARHDPLCLAS